MSNKEDLKTDNLEEEVKSEQSSCKGEGYVGLSKNDTLDETKNTSGYSSDEGNDEDTEEEEGSESWLENLRNFFVAKLSVHDKKEEEIPQILEDVSIEGVVKYIKSGKCENIITMAGAGISTSAGIPDFRSPGSGLYNNLAKYDLPHPEAIFDIEFFKSNPQPFFVLAKELYPGAFNPTPSHYFIKLLHDKGFLLRHYTQNVDTLEHIAGIPTDKLVEAHGTFRTSHCLQCKKSYEQSWMKVEIFADRIPTCTECSGVVKPDIVFFREGLPSRFFEMMPQDFKKCDLLIILGTSLTVQPFASLVDNVSNTCPRLLINREKVGGSNSMMSALEGMFGSGGGLRLESPNNKRDVSMIGDCDEQCRIFARKLGWEDELENLLQKNDINKL